jgi:hypothetical protein
MRIINTAAALDDFRRKLGAGQVPGLGDVQKFGLNPGVTTGAYQDIWEDGGLYPWPQVARAVRIAAGGDANDAAAGTGARAVTIVGLDENWQPVEETVATAGASASALTSALFIRVFRAFVSDAGSYTGTNDADIRIEESTGTDTLAVIPAESGQTQMAIYTIPDGRIGRICFVWFAGSSAQTYNVRLYKRERADIVAAPFGPVRVVTQINGVVTSGDRPFCVAPAPLPARTDVWMAAVANGGAGVSMSGEFDLWLEDAE